MPRKSRRPALTMPKPVRRRTTYAQRTRQGSRVARPLLEAVNGSGQHWSHADIRTALLRQRVIERDDLSAELPSPAISYAVTKGWLYRHPGEDWLYVTQRAAADLELPKKSTDGRKIAFLDTAKLAPSAAAFDPKPAKPEISEMRAAELVAKIAAFAGDFAAEGGLYRAVIAETQWSAAEIARRLGGDDAKLVDYWWNRVLVFLALAGHAGVSAPVRELVAALPAQHRDELFAAIRSGSLNTWDKIKRRANRLTNQ